MAHYGEQQLKLPRQAMNQPDVYWTGIEITEFYPKPYETGHCFNINTIFVCVDSCHENKTISNRLIIMMVLQRLYMVVFVSRRSPEKTPAVAPFTNVI